MNHVSQLPNLNDIRNNDIFEIKYNKSSGTHSYFKYPAKFIPEIPAWAIRNFTDEGNNVLDCFAGSGTSLVEASRLKRKPFAIDFDPLSQLLCKVKTTHFTNNQLIELRRLKSKIISSDKGSYSPSLDNLDHWFSKENIINLGELYSSIFYYCSKKQIYKNFFLVVLASIIRRCSYSDLVSPKPYVSKSHKREPAEPKKEFSDTVDKFLNIYKNKKSLHIKAKIIGNDAAKANNEKYHNFFELVVASPPYINAFDYVRILRLENIWLDLISEEQILDHKRKQIGTEMIAADLYRKTPQKIGINKLDLNIKNIFKVDKRRAHIVHKYFSDMEKNFLLMNKYLKLGGKYVCVVGDSVIRGNKIEVSKFLGQIGKRNNFKIDKQFSYLIKNPYLRIPRSGKGGHIKYDNVLVLSKTNA